jgi:hypothetical protein
MRRFLAFGLTFLIGLTVGGIAGAKIVADHAEREVGHDFVVDLMKDGWAAREIYRGQGRQHADRLRDGFPQQVLFIEKSIPKPQPDPKDFFSEYELRNRAFRVVREAYEASGSEVPTEIRQVLLTVPDRPNRAATPRAK